MTHTQLMHECVHHCLIKYGAALLMPKKFLFKDLPDLLPLDEEKVRKLARRYQVSEQAMTIRLVNLGFLSPD